MSKADDRAIVTPETLEAFLKERPQWIAQGEAQGLTLRRRYLFSAYLRGLGFVNAAAEHAEAADHHPDLTLGYRWVTAVLTTHVSRGVSKLDLELAEVLDRLYQEHL